MTINEVFSRGTRLAEVPADARGAAWSRFEDWTRFDLSRQFKEWANAPAPLKNRRWIDSEDPTIKRAGFGKGRVATERDSYGLKGV